MKKKIFASRNCFHFPAKLVNFHFNYCIPKKNTRSLTTGRSEQAEIADFTSPFGWEKEENILPYSKSAVQGGRLQISIGNQNILAWLEPADASRNRI